MMTVLATWLGGLSLFRLRSPADRVHIIGFVNVATGVCLLLAAALTDGATPRLAKIAAVITFSLLAGAASAHLIGRALFERGDR